MKDSKMYLIHVLGCGMPAMMYVGNDIPAEGTPVTIDDFRTLGGGRFLKGGWLACGVCGERLGLGDIRIVYLRELDE